MSSTYEIPLSPNPQIFTITLAGIDYTVRIAWCTASQSWVIYFADSNNTPILSGIPLVTGVDLFEQYGYLNLGGVLLAYTDNDLSAPPDFTNLGLTGHVLFVVPPA